MIGDSVYRIPDFFDINDRLVVEPSISLEFTPSESPYGVIPNCLKDPILDPQCKAWLESLGAG